MSADKKSGKKNDKKGADDDKEVKHEPSFQGGLPRATDPFGSKSGTTDQSDNSARTGADDESAARSGRARARAQSSPGDAAADAIAAIARRHSLKAEPDSVPDGEGEASMRSDIKPVGESSTRGTPQDRSPRTPPSHNPPPHNPMYDKLVDNEDDLIGLIAYALYKQHKRDWLKAFQAENARTPREDEVNSFLLGERTANRLRSFREQAATVLTSYADSVVADARPQILVDAIEGKIRSSLRWWKQIPAGLAGAVLFIALIAAGVYLMAYFSISPNALFGFQGH